MVVLGFMHDSYVYVLALHYTVTRLLLNHIHIHVQAHQSNTVVVTSQPTVAVYRPEAPSWVGTDGLIYFSIFTMVCCGLLPGIVALLLSWEVSRAHTHYTILNTLFTSATMATTAL